MKKFLISEEERSRILGMHHNAIRKEFLFEAGPPMADDTLGITDPTTTKTPVATTNISYPWLGPDGKPNGDTLVDKLKADPNFQNWLGELKKLNKEQLEKVQNDLKTFSAKNPDGTQNPEYYRAWLVANTTIKDAFGLIGTGEQGATTPEQGTKELHKELTSQDKDYEYKKVGNKYYFKLKQNPTSTKAKEFLKQKKFTDWTEAKNPKAIGEISKLRFEPIKGTLEVKPLSTMKVDSTTTSSGATSGTTIGGGGKPLAQLAGTPTPDLLKQFPNLGTLDQATQTKITTWTKSPAGQYILNTPADQREKAMDNLDKMFGGDPLTKELKKPIRQALGMKADGLFGRVGSAIKGGVEGVKQGFNQQK